MKRSLCVALALASISLAACTPAQENQLLGIGAAAAAPACAAVTKNAADNALCLNAAGIAITVAQARINSQLAK